MLTASCEEKSVHRDVVATLMGEVDIGKADLAQRFDRSTEEALKDLIGDPLAIRFGVRCPYLDRHRRKHRKDVYWPLSELANVRMLELLGRRSLYLKSQRLPDQTTPAKEQEHIAGPFVQCFDRNAGVQRYRYEHRVDRCRSNANHECVHVDADGEHQLPLRSPIQRIVRIGRGCGNEDNIILARAGGVSGSHNTFQIYKVDCAGNEVALPKAFDRHAG